MLLAVIVPKRGVSETIATNSVIGTPKLQYFRSPERGMRNERLLERSSDVAGRWSER